jgi:hypothetical protein
MYSQYQITINNFTGQTPCNGYYVYTGLTTNINNAGFINEITTLIPIVNGYSFTIELLSSISKIYLFIEHCDGHVNSVPSNSPKLQGGYQIVSVNLTCNNCYEQPIPSITPTISVTPSITLTISVTPSITPTISVTPSITPSVTPSLTPSVTPSITPTSSLTPSVTPSVTPTITPTPTPSTSEICCKTWRLTDTGAHLVFNWIDCNNVSQTWFAEGQPENPITNDVCACDTPYINNPPPIGWSVTLLSNTCP